MVSWMSHMGILLVCVSLSSRREEIFSLFSFATNSSSNLVYLYLNPYLSFFLGKFNTCPHFSIFSTFHHRCDKNFVEVPSPIEKVFTISNAWKEVSKDFSATSNITRMINGLPTYLTHHKQLSACCQLKKLFFGAKLRLQLLPHGSIASLK